MLLKFVSMAFMNLSVQGLMAKQTQIKAFCTFAEILDLRIIPLCPNRVAECTERTFKRNLTRKFDSKTITGCSGKIK